MNLNRLKIAFCSLTLGAGGLALFAAQPNDRKLSSAEPTPPPAPTKSVPPAPGNDTQSPVLLPPSIRLDEKPVEKSFDLEIPVIPSVKPTRLELSETAPPPPPALKSTTPIVEDILPPIRSSADRKVPPPPTIELPPIPTPNIRLVGGDEPVSSPLPPLKTEPTPTRPSIPSIDIDVTPPAPKTPSKTVAEPTTIAPRLVDFHVPLPTPKISAPVIESPSPTPLVPAPAKSGNKSGDSAIPNAPKLLLDRDPIPMPLVPSTPTPPAPPRKTGTSAPGDLTAPPAPLSPPATSKDLATSPKDVTPLTPPLPTVEKITEIAPPPYPKTSVNPIPTVPTTAKLRMLVRMGDGRPRFEIRGQDSDEVLLKAYGDKLEMQPQGDGKSGIAGVSAAGKVRFTAPGVEGTCDQLSILSATGEVLLKGNVMVKTKRGKTWSEMSSEKMIYQIGSSGLAASSTTIRTPAIPAALKRE